jgi:hypothetical protein
MCKGGALWGRIPLTPWLSQLSSWLGSFRWALAANPGPASKWAPVAANQGPASRGGAAANQGPTGRWAPAGMRDQQANGPRQPIRDLQAANQPIRDHVGGRRPEEGRAPFPGRMRAA